MVTSFDDRDIEVMHHWDEKKHYMFTSCKKDDKAWKKCFFKEQYSERTSFYSYTRSVVVTQHHQIFQKGKVNLLSN